MSYAQGTHKSWIATCPTSDGNFKIHLKQASVQDLQEVIGSLPEYGNKTKLKVLKAELRKRLKEIKE